MSQFLPRHGEAHATPEWVAWRSMKQRCLNSSQDSYRYYGGRGIRVCERWLNSYEAFLSDVGRRPSPAHSIDRVDRDGDYEPGNVRWATPEEQAGNRATVRLLTVDGVTATAAEWGRRVGMDGRTIRRRLDEGLSAEAAIRPGKRRTGRKPREEQRR